MKGRALVLGCATGSLMGVSNDVQAMARWLGEVGMQLDVREGVDATREGVLDGLARLTRDIRRGEAAVVYYSGHGGFVSVPPEQRLAGGRFAPRAFQYLVPTDHDKLRSFRGVFRVELSSAMQGLAERTSNITVILDCCHSTDMVREDDLELKGVVEPWSEGVEAHVAWLLERGYDLEWLPELRNPSMVLVAACGAAQKSFEHTRAVDRVRCGLFTGCLLEAVSTAPDPSRVTWDGLMRRVVERVQRVTKLQRPQVSGPSSRRLLSERRERSGGELTLQLDADRWQLSGGSAAGVVRGDRYCIVDPLAEDTSRPLAELVVDDVETHVAVVSVGDAAADRLSPGMVALSRPGGPVHQRCLVAGEGALAEELRRRLANVPGLEVAESSDGGGDVGVAFVLAVRGEELDVLDEAGRRLRWTWRDAGALEPSLRRERLDGLVEDLRTLVRGSDLLSLARRLARATSSRAPAHVVEWGRVDRGVPRPLPRLGAELRVGERIYVSVQNTGVRAIHVSLLDVGVGRHVVLLNRNEPEGVDLAAGDTELFGLPEVRAIQGFELVWPDEVPPDGPREESLVVFVASSPLPVRSWESVAPDGGARHRDVVAPSRGPRAPELAVTHVRFLLHQRR